jgi:hypothetical protein
VLRVIVRYVLQTYCECFLVVVYRHVECFFELWFTDILRVFLSHDLQMC